MLEHLRHLRRAIDYNQSSLRQPRRLVPLVKAWYHNEVGYLRRSSRLRAILGTDSRTLKEALRETNEVLLYCANELRRHSSLLPGLINPNYGPVLYAMVRNLRPDVVVETGVASGISSTFFLEAMERNGKGRLYSIDLPSPNAHLIPAERETRWLVPERLKGRWELILGDARQELPALLTSLGEVDCFLHDSDHSFEHMTWEFTLAYPRIRPDGILLSDDITANRAWDEFVRQHDDPSTRINRTGILKKVVG